MASLLLALTLLAFALGVTLQRKFRSPLLNPTLIAVLLMIALLLALRISYAAYAGAARPLSALLTPAVVALAVPMYRQRALLLRQWRALILGGMAGTLTAMAVGWFGGSLLQLGRGPHLALLTASATSPVALAVAGRLGGAPPLAAALAIWAGLVGATVLPAFLSKLGVRSPLARGVTLGSVSHGIGTARVREEGDLAGAASSLGMGLGALVVTLAASLLR